MNKTVFKVLKWVTVGFLVTFVFAQFYLSVMNPVTTDTVYEYSTYSGWTANGFIIRNETVLEQTVSGSLAYNVENGGRVSKNGSVASVYSDTKSAEICERIEKLDKQIKVLQSVQVYNDSAATDLSALNSKIKNKIFEISAATQNGKVSETEAVAELLQLINRKQIVTGQATDFNTLIASLRAERDALKAAAATATGSVNSPSSGYVIYSVDGYENTLKPEIITELTAEKMANIEKQAVSENAVCKIVSDYEWYISIVIPFDEALNLREGSTVKLLTPLVSAPELTVTVKSINKQSAQENAVATFACKTMNTELAEYRNLEVTVVYNQHSGLKVDNRAIRVLDGKRGVYVLTASQVKFVPVNVIYEGENYSIVEKEVSNSKVLRLYDEIIVKGKNLYDGKIFN